MINSINKIIGGTETKPSETIKKVAGSNVTFSDVLDKVLSEVNTLQKEDIKAKEALSLGNIDNLHDPMIASEKADIALQFTLKVHGKIIEAYKEIMRLQV
ncbi:MAG: flagellar hook-basal body complex protein FliE [Tissierellales bacterium]|jgi:flagellar hook-basal body complex protein FliE|nr:flagellar hook-basal body complex protein FliE [Tissierellales bacterium]